jgi:hypothetical protein
MYEAIAAAALEIIKAVIAQIEEAKLADDDRKAAILARLQSSGAALDLTLGALDAELAKLKQT